MPLRPTLGSAKASMRALLGRADDHDDDAQAFVDDCYRRLLGRPADPEGLAHFTRLLEQGMPRAEVVMSLATSTEYKQGILVASTPRRRRAHRYRLALDTTRTSAFVAFDVAGPADFDWLEAAIIDDGYYEHEGIWSLDPDEDKRVMGAALAGLGPRRALEIGCSSGTVLGVLRGHGVDADGIDVSRMAYDHAAADVQPNIHVGDLLDLDLACDYDLVFGLDVFEHLNPNRFPMYCAALYERVRPGGLFFANIPAFGRDAVFGEVFPLYLDEWHADVAAQRPFRVLHCDDDGYPMNGHLIWAHTDWWVAQFQAVGFTRRPDLEREIHERHGDHFRAEPARRSFYVFARGD